MRRQQVEPAKRPFRLYNAQTKEYLRWRCYAVKRNAHIGALVETRWSQVGVTIEVVNIDTGHQHGSYTRTATGVRVLGGDRV